MSSSLPLAWRLAPTSGVTASERSDLDPSDQQRYELLKQTLQTSGSQPHHRPDRREIPRPGRPG